MITKEAIEDLLDKMQAEEADEMGVSCKLFMQQLRLGFEALYEKYDRDAEISRLRERAAMLALHREINKAGGVS